MKTCLSCGKKFVSLDDSTQISPEIAEEIREAARMARGEVTDE